MSVAAVAAVILFQSFAMAQIRDARTLRPAVESWDVRALDQVAKIRMPRVDADKARQEDQLLLQQGFPQRFALPNQVRMTPATHGTWENLDPDTLLWRLQVTSPGARSINLGFTRYLMPADGRLLIYSADGKEVIRPFTDLDNKDHHRWGYQPVISTATTTAFPMRATSASSARTATAMTSRMNANKTATTTEHPMLAIAPPPAEPHRFARLSWSRRADT